MAKKFFDHRDIKWPGAWLVEQDIIPEVPEIPFNRTLFIQQLTDEAPSEPEFVKDCRTMEDVFNTFKPSKEVQFEDEEGIPTDETLEFKMLTDFGKDGIIRQSNLLQDIQQKEIMYADFIKRLRSVTILQKLISDPEAKAAYLESLQGFIDELDEIEPDEA